MWFVSGTAVVLANDAAVWTDGRYHDEAEDALDCNWILMKQGRSHHAKTNNKPFMLNMLSTFDLYTCVKKCNIFKSGLFHQINALDVLIRYGRIKCI